MSEEPTYEQLLARYRGMTSALKLAADDLQVPYEWPENLDHRDVLDKYIVDPTVRKIDGLEEIVRELAERGPFLNVDVHGDAGTDCADCQAHDSARTPLSDPANHEPSCLYRRAKALYPGASA